jgi:hypothetical protein
MHPASAQLGKRLVCLSHPALAHRAIVKPRGSPPKPRDYRSLGAKRVSRDADGGDSFSLLQQRRSAPLQARANGMARQPALKPAGMCFPSL